MPRPWNRHDDCQHDDTAPARERCRYARLHANCDHPPTVHHGRVCEGKRDAVPHSRVSPDAA